MKRFRYLTALIVVISFLSGCALKPDNSKSADINSIKTAPSIAAQAEDVQAKKPAPKKSPANPSKASGKSTTQKPAQPVKNRVIPKAPANSKSSESVKVKSNIKQVVVNPPAQNTQTSQGQSTSTQTSSSNIPGMPSYTYAVSSYQEYYNAIYSSLKNFEGTVNIKVNNYDSKTYNLNVVEDVIYDHYDIDYGIQSTEATIYSSSKLNIMSINFKYGFDKSKMISMRDASNAKASQIISEIISPGMTDIQKELAIHDYIVNHTSYDYNNYVNGTLPGEDFTDYGVLLKGKAVCEGYAKAMFKLLNRAGIENKVVTGEAEGIPHAWNLAKINGVYTHVDATWDDPVTTSRRSILTHDYFNISDEQISKDHTWNQSKYPNGVAVPLQ